MSCGRAMPTEMSETPSASDALERERFRPGRRLPGFWSYGRVVKRCVDIVFTIFLLPIIAPFAVLVCLLIKLDSRGPVLVKLKRIGKHRANFYKYKFRTMVPDAENVLQE